MSCSNKINTQKFNELQILNQEESDQARVQLNQANDDLDQAYFRLDEFTPIEGEDYEESLGNILKRTGFTLEEFKSHLENLKNEVDVFEQEVKDLEEKRYSMWKSKNDLNKQRKEYALNLKSKFLEFLKEKNLKIEDDFYWQNEGRSSEYLYFFDLGFEDGIKCFRFSNHPKGENHLGMCKNSGETYSVNYSGSFDIHNKQTLDQALKMVKNSLSLEKRVG